MALFKDSDARLELRVYFKTYKLEIDRFESGLVDFSHGENGTEFNEIVSNDYDLSQLLRFVYIYSLTN